MVEVVVFSSLQYVLLNQKHVAQAVLCHWCSLCFQPADANAEHSSQIAAFPGSPSGCTSRPGP